MIFFALIIALFIFLIYKYPVFRVATIIGLVIVFGALILLYIPAGK